MKSTWSRETFTFSFYPNQPSGESKKKGHGHEVDPQPKRYIKMGFHPYPPLSRLLWRVYCVSVGVCLRFHFLPVTFIDCSLFEASFPLSLIGEGIINN